MRIRFNPAAFAIAFSCTYAAAFWFNRPLFLFYPLNGDLVWGRTLLVDAGPAMAWYGLMADAGLVAGMLAVVIPGRATEPLRGYLWVFPAAALGACLYLLRAFFLR